MNDKEWFGKIQTSDTHWKMLPQDCGGRQLNPWRLNSGSPTSFCKMSQSPKRLGLLRYVSKSSSWVVGEPDSMGSGWYISRGEFRGWGVFVCSESRERDKRKMVFLYSWLLLFLVLLSLRKWEWQKCDVLHIPKKTGRTIRTKRIRFSAFFCMHELHAEFNCDCNARHSFLKFVFISKFVKINWKEFLCTAVNPSYFWKSTFTSLYLKY